MSDLAGAAAWPETFELPAQGSHVIANHILEYNVLHGLNSQSFLVANDTAYIHSRSYCPTLRVAPTQHSRTRSLSTRVWLCCCKVNGPL